MYFSINNSTGSSICVVVYIIYICSFNTSIDVLCTAQRKSKDYNIHPETLYYDPIKP